LVTNTAQIDGVYKTLPATLTTEEVTTQMVSGLTVTKTADKQMWASGNLTYTIVVKNDAGDTFSNIEVTDVLDITKIALVANTVQLDGKTVTYIYTAATGTLSVKIPDLADDKSGTITFQVSKV